jgi:hypothetical protein
MRLLVVLGLTTLLAACAVQQNPAKTKVYTPYGSYEYHCPPGQKKKGNC